MTKREEAARLVQAYIEGVLDHYKTEHPGDEEVEIDWRLLRNLLVRNGFDVDDAYVLLHEIKVDVVDYLNARTEWSIYNHYNVSFRVRRKEVVHQTARPS